MSNQLGPAPHPRDDGRFDEAIERVEREHAAAIEATTILVERLGDDFERFWLLATTAGSYRLYAAIRSAQARTA